MLLYQVVPPSHSPTLPLSLPPPFPVAVPGGLVPSLTKRRCTVQGAWCGVLLTQLLRETSVLILGQQPLPFMVGGGLSGGASTQQVV
jgi:hypothetical protein